VHVHILGICGTFMAGIAALAREAGHRVSGSDANAWPPMSTQLEQLGITIHRGYDAAQFAPRPDVVVVGNVISRGNPAIEYVLDHELPYVSGPQWLAQHVLNGRHVLAVAGTHGKTTTTSMLSWILDRAGLKPGFLIGGVAPDFGVSARLGTGRHFVVEADEYDTAFFDKRSKFVHYRPRTLVLNNLEYDHADIFPDLAAIERQFHHLVRTVPGNGRIVVNARDANLARVLAQGCWTPQVTFGGEAGWHLRKEARKQVVWHGEERIGVLSLRQAGEHNQANALAAIAAAHFAGVLPADAVAALADFGGVNRRMEVVGTAGGVTVYDDFAHHPTAVRLTLEAAGAGRRRKGRVIAVLEPRSNTMRLGTHADTLADALACADQSVVYVRPDLDWNAGAALSSLGERLRIGDSIESVIAAVVEIARPGDYVVIMSNGDFGGIHRRLLEALHSSNTPTKGEDTPSQ
jgi:UDP-N-acetylmuramate: L-alanyl-gamma-D-glutamyl-meso-diaminopimelate ligase